VQTARPPERCDVVVVGGGSAAFEAAVAARQHGAERVIMLEKAPEAEYGGNARFSHTGFRFAFSGPDEIRAFIPEIDEATFRRMHLPAYSEADFLADLQRTCRGRVDPELAELLVRESNPAVHWMRELGIRWEPETSVEVNGRLYFEPGGVIHVAGDGIGQLQQWREIAQRMAIELRFDSRVIALLGSARRVEGVQVSGPDGDYELTAPATILCSGGFQASAELRARYLGPGSDLMKVRGSRHDTGEVLQMALALGACSSGHWQGAHASPIDATYPDVEISNKANRYSYLHGITVNALGQRFFDEGEAEHTYTYAKTGWAVVSQPGAVAWQLFDRKGINLLRWQYRRHAEPVEADSLEELARKIRLEPVPLLRTIEQFNQAVRDDVPFDPSRLDGKCTVGLTPPKSNWAAPIDEPPFQAYPVTGGITFTFGGLRVNPDAQVLNTGLRPIEGLYASGDVVGMFFYNYPSLTGQTRNVVFSRQAGRHAARAVGVTS
jgi:tricarballylate dehydrogenase